MGWKGGGASNLIPWVVLPPSGHLYVLASSCGYQPLPDHVDQGRTLLFFHPYLSSQTLAAFPNNKKGLQTTLPTAFL